MLRLLYIFLLFGLYTYGGPVSNKGYPLARMNSEGDFVLAGNLKSYVRWRGYFQSVKGLYGERFTGGIAERNKSDVGAIICSNQEAFLFYPGKVLGNWEKKYSGKNIVCEMDKDGYWAIFDLDKGLFYTPFHEILVERITSYAVLVKIANHFMLISENSYVFSKNGKFKRVPSIPIHPLMAVVGNENMLLLADDSGVFYYPVKEDIFPVIFDRQRIPVSPCEEEQLCGLSIASDNSWVVSGYWGTWIGVEKNFRRVNMINASQPYGGVAFAHSGNGGYFVYSANDDGDLGSLDMFDFDFTKSNFFDDSYAVWLKEKDDRYPVIVPEVRIRDGVKAVVVKYSGTPDERNSSDWIAWEKNVEIITHNNFENTYSLWWIKDVLRDEAWNYITFNPLKVLIGVVDSGIKNELINIEVNNLEKENGLDDDSNGFVDDIIGYDFVDEDPYPEDTYGHGTHVAGLLASNVSIAKNARVVVARALDDYGRSNSIDLSRAISYLVQKKVELLNCSWGGGSVTQALFDAFQYAVSNNIMVFTSAGNAGLNHDKFPQVPGVFNGVISVGSYSKNGRRSSFSNYGKKTVSFMAPGKDIISTLKDGSLGSMTGTSMSSPIAASLAAWIMGILKTVGLNGEDLVRSTFNIMCESARNDNSSTCGKIDVLKSTIKAVEVRNSYVK